MLQTPASLRFSGSQTAIQKAGFSTSFPKGSCRKGGCSPGTWQTPGSTRHICGVLAAKWSTPLQPASVPKCQWVSRPCLTSFFATQPLQQTTTPWGPKGCARGSPRAQHSRQVSAVQMQSSFDHWPGEQGLLLGPLIQITCSNTLHKAGLNPTSNQAAQGLPQPFSGGCKDGDPTVGLGPSSSASASSG